MKKKNKVENSLERLFSAKKSDFVSNEDTVEDKPEETTTVEKTAEKKKKSKVKTAKTEKKEAKKSASKKAKAEKKPADIPVPSVSETSHKLPVENMKQAEPEPKVASTPQLTPKSEAPEKPQEKVSEKENKTSSKDKTAIDKPMTDAIVATKASEYDADEHLVIFSLADQAYGISIMIVESIIKMQDITHVPRAHPAIEGATNLRGVVLPVIDLCKKMNLQASTNEEDKRIIVVAAEDITAGFVVDNVQSVYRISSKEIAPPSPMATTIDQKYIKGIAKNGEHGLVIILEPVCIFESIISESIDISQKKRIK